MTLQKEEQRSLIHQVADALFENGVFFVDEQPSPEGIMSYSVKIRVLGMVWRLATIS